MRGVPFTMFVALAMLVQPAVAGSLPSDWSLGALRGGYLHLGLAAVKQADAGTISLGGAPFPGAGYTTALMAGAGLEAGLFLPGGFALSVSGTAPMTTGNIGAGTLAGVGNLGDETDGFYALTAHYHVAVTDAFVPYLGAGLGYMQVFGTKDGVIDGLAVQSAAGLVAQAGVDVHLAGQLGLFADVKRFFLSTEATGNFGAAPVVAAARVDPWIVTTGASLSF